MHSGSLEAELNALPEKTQPLPLPEKTNEIPFTPLEENIDRLEDWLLQHFSSTTFNTDRDPLPVMEGEPHHIHLKPDAVPYAC